MSFAFAVSATTVRVFRSRVPILDAYLEPFAYASPSAVPCRLPSNISNRLAFSPFLTLSATKSGGSYLPFHASPFPSSPSPSSSSSSSPSTITIPTTSSSTSTFFSASSGLFSTRTASSSPSGTEATPGAMSQGQKDKEGNPEDSIIVYVTAPNKEAAQALGRSVVSARLAACVNRVPGIESTYWWKGEVQSDAEELLIIKTRQSLLPDLTHHVNTHHPYDLPEVVAIPIVGGSEKYLQWIQENTRSTA